MFQRTYAYIYIQHMFVATSCVITIYFAISLLANDFWLIKNELMESFSIVILLLVFHAFY